MHQDRDKEKPRFLAHFNLYKSFFNEFPNYRFDIKDVSRNCIDQDVMFEISLEGTKNFVPYFAIVAMFELFAMIVDDDDINDFVRQYFNTSL